MNKTNKRACMVAYSFYEMDNRVRRYAETLADEGWSVDAVAIQNEKMPKNDVLNNVNVHRLQKRIINEKSKWSYLLRLLCFFWKSFFWLAYNHLRKPFQIIHIHSVPDFEVFAALIPKLLGAHVILDIHDIVPEFYASKFNTGQKTLLFKALLVIEKLSCAFADHVIISNHIWGERLIKRSVSQKKTSVIINYPDPKLFSQNQKKQKKASTFIYPGTLNWHQGLDIAIDGFAIVHRKMPDATLKIFGKGPEKEALKRKIVEMNLSDVISVFDAIPMEEIVKEMRNADFGIVPKRNDNFGGEAFSTKILEFMLLGIPVIISRTVIDQYYFNDSLVTFFEPENELSLSENVIYALNNHKEIEKKRVAALKFAQENSWKVKKQHYLDMINSFSTR